MKKSKVAEEIKLIALLAIMIPTAVMLTLSPLWYGADGIKVLAVWLLLIIGTAVLLGTVSVHDEEQEAKERAKNGR